MTPRTYSTTQGVHSYRSESRGPMLRLMKKIVMSQKVKAGRTVGVGTKVGVTIGRR
jgi:hypothetical protein